MTQKDGQKEKETSYRNPRNPNPGRRNLTEPLMLVLLFWYPLRHIFVGLDFWDTGYNYANFLYMGTEHMDPMWLFSTYLANAVGHILTGLPKADTLAGMNLYTGLFVGVLAVMGYRFCTRKLQIPGWIAFLGEFSAISLCWCPTALLYNYLTYVLFTGCVLLLYEGLTGEKMRCLLLAGICLGANVFVRFSNLPEAAMITAVWFYAFLTEWDGQTPDGGIKKILGKTWRRAVSYTAWCLGGYLAAVAVMAGYIHLRYGLGSYMEGIGRLFAMTENATDYQAGSMITRLVYAYLENLYWVWRFVLIVLLGTAGFAVAGLIIHWLKKAEGALWFLTKTLWCAVMGLMAAWLYYRGFCATEYFTYGAILRPGITFLTLAMGIAAVLVIYPGVKKEERLMSCMVILVVLLSSIGSNNGVYPSLNHLFVVAPYTFYQCFRFLRSGKDLRPEEARDPQKIEKLRQSGKTDWLGYAIRGLVISAFPMKAVLATFLCIFFFQSSRFGMEFVFAEATGVREPVAVVTGSAVLEGVRMNPERAAWMQEIQDFVNENQLAGREVILFGNIPAMSYYLKMPPAFNPWPDLDSYHAEVMEEALSRMEQELAAGADAKSRAPLILMEREYAEEYALYLAGHGDALAEAGVSGKRMQELEKNRRKALAIQGFCQRLNYNLIFKNDKFVLFSVE